MEMGGGVREMVDKGNAMVDGRGGDCGKVDRGGGVGGGAGGGGEAEREGFSNSTPQKLARIESFPFRMPPFSRCDNGPTFYNNSSSSEVRSSDLYDVPGGAVAAAAAATRTLQPFPVAFKSPGMTSLRCPFTAAQWQELEQQALIFKHMVAEMPVPPDLLVPIRRSLAEASSIANSATAAHLGWGGFNLRFSNTTDPEPGRCRRTDGKKWRCSRDVAPDQKYCERHMHRGRPRSRKPVEVQLQRHSSSNNSNSSGSSNAPLPTSSASVSRSLPLPSPLSSSTSSCSSSSSSSFSSLTSPPSDPFPKPFQSSWFKLPVQTMMPSSFSDKSSRYMNWTRGEMNGVASTGRDSTAASHQWELVQSKLGEIQEHHQLKLCTNTSTTTPLLGYHENMGLIPETDNRTSLFLDDDLTGLESAANSQQMQPRCFIDAWSRENRWLPTTTTAATATATAAKSTASNLTLSPLSLSMCAYGGSATDDMDAIQMGLGMNDSDNNGGLKHHQQAPNWMLPVTWQSSSPLGGPLAEVLQSSGSTAAPPNSPKGCSSKSSSSGLNLLTDGWGGGSSPRVGSPRMASSPTGVLQKTLASLSDSSSGSSPTFGAKSEIALQWLNQQPPKLPSSSGVI